jgi:hypothetical protein
VAARAQYAYYMHRPAERLHDVGFDLVPVRARHTCSCACAASQLR